MTLLEKITIEPVPEGFSKVDGTSVEEVLGILESKGINRYLVHPSERHFDEDRQHTIILTRADYHRLMHERTFGEAEFRGPGITHAGLFCDARYSDGQTTKSEITQMRLFHAMFAPEDHYFLEVNGIKVADAIKPYEG